MIHLIPSVPLRSPNHQHTSSTSAWKRPSPPTTLAKGALSAASRAGHVPSGIEEESVWESRPVATYVHVCRREGKEERCEHTHATYISTLFYPLLAPAFFPIQPPSSPLTQREGRGVDFEQVPQTELASRGGGGGGREGEEALRRPFQVRGAPVRCNTERMSELPRFFPICLLSFLPPSLPPCSEHTYRKTLPRPVPVREAAP